MTKTGEAARPQLDESADSFMEWAQANARSLGIGAIVIAALGAGTWVVSRSNETKALAASRALAESQRSVASGNLPLAAADLQKVVQRYGSTNAGVQAKLLLAQVLFQQEKVDEGLKLLDETGKAGALQSSLHGLRAGGLEQAGKPAEAAAEYLKASQSTSLSSERESYKADAARALVAAGKKDEALKIWQAMADDQASPLNSEARLRVGELSATVASK
ncbi:MAG: tetratricopeptide repeat protein [Gemmatimonadetes bacterium]|nr:tetratricopeptide repeat protein [Gemmatimonadota bacterium]MCC6769911.1 tetratricopeptide repeat protein [Gemmatimonadaceae bacterium]